MNDLVIILDFGSQFTQLIARRLRELNIYCEIHPYNKFEPRPNVKAVILSGSPYSVLDTNALEIDFNQLVSRYPLLCICYGAQLVSHTLGGRVHKSDKREYGKASLSIELSDPIFDRVENESQIWMSHSDSIEVIPADFDLIARSSGIPAAYRSKPNAYKYPIYCLQFHPEVTHSLCGSTILENFIVNIAKLNCDWTPASMIEESVHRIREMVGDDHVMMGLSGGVDSSVAAMLIHKAIGDRLHCVFINNGLLRKNEFASVLESYKGIGLNIKGVDATHAFLSELEGITDPEQKRKTIGRVFIEVFQAEAKSVPDIKWLGQGTIYPDVIESVSVHGPSVTIKSHHNVGGLPDLLHLSLVEPLRMLFKDEVRAVGRKLDMPSHLIDRHPFPGPGLGIRILGAINHEKIALCQEADFIFIDHLKKSGWYSKVWQAGAILLPIQSVGVMGDERTYEFTCALRCVQSVDGMTAEWSPLPHELLAQISSDIINKVKGINRVVYDISTKPPATIEWE
jgi:GMP synthase (glutamine-hydrolysing)